MGLRPDQLLIAEVKTTSPFGWEAEESWEERFEIADQIAEKRGENGWVAVHTEEPWGGSLELLAEARSKTNKPLLAKGLHETDESVEQALAAGADTVLVVGQPPRIHRDRCIIEPRNLYELRTIALSGLRLAWNSRDLETGEPKTDPTDGQLLGFSRIIEMYPESIFCQASYIRTPDDVDPRAEAVLVGTHLPEFVSHL